jgi:hypothetical protein
VPQRNAELFQVLLSQFRQDFPINVIFSKQLGILSQSNLFQPVLQIGHLGTQPELFRRPSQARLEARRHGARKGILRIDIPVGKLKLVVAIAASVPVTTDALGGVVLISVRSCQLRVFPQELWKRIGENGKLESDLVRTMKNNRSAPIGWLSTQRPRHRGLPRFLSAPTLRP